jgi:hypothetical protein
MLRAHFLSKVPVTAGTIAGCERSVFSGRPETYPLRREIDKMSETGALLSTEILALMRISLPPKQLGGRLVKQYNVAAHYPDDDLESSLCVCGILVHDFLQCQYKCFA